MHLIRLLLLKYLFVYMEMCERWLKSEPSADPISEPGDGSAIKQRSCSMMKQATSILDQQVAHSSDSDHMQGASQRCQLSGRAIERSALKRETTSQNQAVTSRE